MVLQTSRVEVDKEVYGNKCGIKTVNIFLENTQFTVMSELTNRLKMLIDI